MEFDKPLLWHQGLFLQPQHLQLSDAHHFSMLRPLHEFMRPFFWGTTGLETREAALQARRFEIVRGEFLFPDHVYAVIPGNAVLLSRSFEEAWVEADKPFAVYLGLHKWDEGGANSVMVGALEDAADVQSRFVYLAEPEEIGDLHGSGKTAQVKRLNYLLRIFWETEKEKSGDYHLIPIAHLVREGEEIKLSTRFIPPCVTISASVRLMGIIKDVRDQVASRCRQLEEFKSPKGLEATEFDMGYLVLLLALRSLNRHLPSLYNLTENPVVHPLDAYGALRQVIAELSTFSDEYTALGEHRDGVRVLPSYDHENLWTCFSTAQRLVGQILDSITVGPGRIIRLEREGIHFSAELPETVLDDRNSFWLILRTAADSARVIREVDMDRLGKLSAAKNLSILLARALPGIPLAYNVVPPPGLPRRGRAFYFRIAHDSPGWADVKSTKRVSFYWDAAPEDLSVEIAVLGG
jgi:type VI secretion system protein ImpJ